MLYYVEPSGSIEPKAKILLEYGTNILGGCRAGPEHIRMMRGLIDVMNT